LEGPALRVCAKYAIADAVAARVELLAAARRDEVERLAVVRVVRVGAVTLTAPTAMTSGHAAGKLTDERPSFPAEATTVTPFDAA